MRVPAVFHTQPICREWSKTFSSPGLVLEQYLSCLDNTIAVTGSLTSQCLSMKRLQCSWFEMHSRMIRRIGTILSFQVRHYAAAFSAHAIHGY